MPERVSWKRMVVTLVVSVAVVLLAIWAVAAMAAWIVGPVSGEGPPIEESVEPVPEPVLEPVEEPAVVPTPTVVPAPTVTPPPASTVTPSTSGLAGYVVVIDPGHQAKGDSTLEPIGPGASEKKPKVASGTSGAATRIPESKTNLAVSLKLRDILQSRGAKVVMVRTSQNVNVANSTRAQIANNAGADLFIRLHCDGSENKSTRGLSTLIPQSNQWTSPIVASSRKAAEIVHPKVIAATGAKNNGVVQRGDLSGFNWAKVPTILIEMGFLSNAAEDRALNSAAYQGKLATGMADGIAAYLQTTPR